MTLVKELMGAVNYPESSSNGWSGQKSNSGMYTREQIKQSCKLNKNIEDMLQALMDDAGLDCNDVTACITSDAGVQGAIELVIETYLAEPVGDGNISRLCELSQDCFQNALESFAYDDANNQFTLTVAANFDTSNGFLTITGAGTVADPFVVVPGPDFCAQVEACILANGLPVGVELFTLDGTAIETGDVVVTTNEITIAGNTITSTVNGVADTVDVIAGNVSYDNATSGIIATDTQAAIDELASDSHTDDDVETVTGSVVDNTDARNPVINAASPADITGLQTQIDSNDTDIAALQALAHADDDVETISGSVVDNTDPRNPVINAVTPAEALLLQTQITGNDVDIAALQANSHVDDDVETVTGTAVDVTDPRNPVIDFQSASNTAITDVAGNYTATDVEGALAEIATSITGIAHTSITSIDLQPTANANEYTVVITWVDENSVTQTTVDATPITITGGTDLGYTASPTNGTVTSTTGADTTLPVVDGTNAGLATPAMFTNSHADDDVETVTGTAVDNTDPRNPVINLQTASQTSFDNVASGLTATDTQAAIDELASNQGDTSVVTQTVTVGNEIASHSDGDATTTSILETITTVVPITDANGVITYVYTNEAGATVTIDPKVILEDEDGNIELLDGSTDALHRTLHVDQGHLGSGIGTSFADADNAAMANISTNHEIAIISARRASNSGLRSIVSGSDNTNTGNTGFTTGRFNDVTERDSLVAGENNTVSAKQSLIVGRNNNVDTGGANGSVGHLIGGSGNTVTEDSNMVVGANNIISGNQNAISGNGNTVETLRNSVTGTANQVLAVNTSVGYNDVAGQNNIITDSRSNTVSGEGNVLTGSIGGAGSSAGNTVSGINNTLTNSSNNTVSGGSNTLNEGVRNIVGGSGNTVDNSGTVGTGDNIVVGTNLTSTDFNSVAVFNDGVSAVRSNQTHVGRLFIDVSGAQSATNARVFADDAAAGAAGLIAGEVYGDPAGFIRYKL